MVWLLIIQRHIIQAHSACTHTSVHVLTALGLLGAAPGLMCNWHDWLSPWQRECWPWQVPREQLVGSGRLVSKQIYSQSSTACPLNRRRNDKEAIRVKENKEGIVVQLSESTDWEEQKPFPSQFAPARRRCWGREASALRRKYNISSYYTISQIFLYLKSVDLD